MKNTKLIHKGRETLINYKRGTINFVDGNWIGYEASHFTVTIHLNRRELILTVSVGALFSPDRWIFYPIGFKVWTSNDGINFKLAKTKNLPSEKPNADT